MIAILTQDLMMSSSANAAARSLGFVLKTATSAAKALELVGEGNCRLLLIDLQMPGLNMEKLSLDLEAMENSCRPHSIAYAQHVNVDVMQRAGDLSFDKVLTRGQINSRLAELMSNAIG